MIAAPRCSIHPVCKAVTTVLNVSISNSKLVIPNRITFQGWKNFGQYKTTKLLLMKLTNVKSEPNHF